jgi:hypothetical protein
MDGGLTAKQRTLMTEQTSPVKVQKMTPRQSSPAESGEKNKWKLRKGGGLPTGRSSKKPF